MMRPVILGAVHTHTHTPSRYKIIENNIEIDKGELYHNVNRHKKWI